MNLNAEVTSKRAQVLQAAGRYDLRDVRLFGSAARGDDDERSDIDLLVTLGPRATGLDLGGFLMEMHDLFGRRVDVATEGMLNPRWRDRALREAVPL
jgi:predicted nucleotidyltransferase